MSRLLGSLDLDGSITSSGDFKFSSGSGIVQLINTFTPTGTASYGRTFDDASTNTSTYLEYGINVVATDSLTSGSYCCRLPQTPKKGKSVTIINNDGVDLFVFPSTASGDINGVVDGYITIPSDGRSYTFDCYENPLPGGWSSNTLPNGNILYNSGVVTYNATPSNSRLAFINNSTKLSGSGYSTAPIEFNANGVFPGLTNINNLGTIGTQGTFVNAYYVPPTTWKKINSISILTNLTSSNSIIISMLIAGTNWNNAFLTGTTTPASYPFGPLNNWTATEQNWAIQNGFSVFFNGGINYWGGVGSFGLGEAQRTTLPGVFTPIPGNPLVSATAGGPGTQKISLNINYNAIGSNITRLIGKSYIGTGMNLNGQLVDAYFNHAFSPIFILQDSNNASISGVKIKMNLSVTLN